GARDVVEVDLPDDADPHLPHPLARGVEVVDLEDDHVAAVAAVPLEVPPGRGPLLDRRDDLEEGVAEREDGVAQAELADAGGGGLGAAVAAAALMNSRFLPMGIALAPSLPGGALKRAAQGQTVVDASWAMAARGDGSYDRWFLFGASAIQYVTWVAGTVAGALGGDLLGDPQRLGL